MALIFTLRCSLGSALSSPERKGDESISHQPAQEADVYTSLPVCLALSRTQILLLPIFVVYIVLLRHSSHDFDHYKELLYIYKEYIDKTVHPVLHDRGSHMFDYMTSGLM